jgi:hypothetical protein
MPASTSVLIVFFICRTSAAVAGCLDGRPLRPAPAPASVTTELIRVEALRSHGAGQLGHHSWQNLTAS